MEFGYGCCCGCFHTICISDGGDVYSFGCNIQGQLGTGDNESRNIPYHISNLPLITKVSCGEYFTLCLDESGYLWSFGENNRGQLGIGNCESQNTPIRIKGISEISSIACGAEHSLCLTNSTELWSFGRNEEFQLCLSEQENTQVSSPKKTEFSNIKLIVAGYRYSIFQDEDGIIYGKGDNELNQMGSIDNKNSRNPKVNTLNFPNNITAIACGWAHSILLDSEGIVYGIGYNSHGQLGLGNTNAVGTLTKIPDLPIIEYIACSLHSTFCVDKDGSVWSCGYNVFGQLGLNSGDDEYKFSKICDIDKIKNISCGFGKHTLIKNADDTIFTCGSNSFGQLAQDKSVRIIIPVTALDDKYSHILGTTKSKFLLKSARK